MALETAPFFFALSDRVLPAQLGRVGQAQTIIGHNSAQQFVSFIRKLLDNNKLAIHRVADGNRSRRWLETQSFQR
jgi:hypothetical protein